MIARLKKGEDFAELAKEVSTGPSGANGGDLGYFQAGAMVPPFSKAAFETEPGSITEKPVVTQFGFHVIKVEDKRETKAPSFEEAAPESARHLGRHAPPADLEQGAVAHT